MMHGQFRSKSKCCISTYTVLLTKWVLKMSSEDLQGYAKYGTSKATGYCIWVSSLCPSKPISMSGINTKPQRDYQAWIPAVQGLALNHIGKLKSNPSAPLSFTRWGEETYFKMKKNMKTSGKQVISRNFHSVEMTFHWRFLWNFIAIKPESKS